MFANKKLKEKVEILSKKCAEFEKEIWSLKNPSEFKKGDKVGDLLITDVFIDCYVYGYGRYSYCYYVTDTAKSNAFRLDSKGIIREKNRSENESFNITITKNTNKHESKNDSRKKGNTKR